MPFKNSISGYRVRDVACNLASIANTVSCVTPLSHSIDFQGEVWEGARSLLQCLPRGLLSVPNAHPQSTYIYRAQSMVWRLPNYWPPPPPPPLHPASVSSPSTKGGGRGVHTRRAVREWEVNISEDAGHWIGLLQYNPSTCSPCKYLDVGHVNVNHLMAVLS